jgi:hypothetical protein
MSSTPHTISKSFHYIFQPGSTFIATQIYFVHPGNGEALSSTITARAQGIGKEVFIRMMQAIEVIRVYDALQIAVDQPRFFSKVNALVMRCLVSIPQLLLQLITNISCSII